MACLVLACVQQFCRKAGLVLACVQRRAAFMFISIWFCSGLCSILSVLVHVCVQVVSGLVLICVQ